ncbi:unnamed protein product [Blepharisma stoltei]|uniref:Threonylcarbamoyl-AMP synthase n=1 Tax=Blepharisma stoltei TaxID=1481888 RepID=A0AAU9JUV5_9CILI|nr:unnamed protein product [Blepharisma stoltei]
MANLCNDLKVCAEHLQQGNLVAFPTETVYGLGANALNEEAVRKIFQAKRRPLNDPVIVHVNSIQEALNLIDENDQEILNTYQYLASQFWPGPLTIICKAGPLISPVLTANTGFVGIRSPRHPLAQQLIATAGVPIAAPSANLFSHVSPTSAGHVMQDFHDSDFDIKVLDGGKCTFGIESTVAKLYREEDELKLLVLRKGGVSERNLSEALEGRNVRVSSRQNYLEHQTNSEAPGQLIKHYSPNIDTYLVVNNSQNEGQELHNLSEAIVIDYHGLLSHINCKARRELSEEGKIDEAINNLYELLRWSEDQNGSYVLIPDLSHITDQHTAALFDRIFRATSGRKVVIRDQNIYSL